MEKIRLKCEIITPMFMSGADIEEPELRPSEFKGMMRWWWRASKAGDDISVLRKEETKIFGGTEKGEGKSRVNIKIITDVDSSDIILYQPLPHHKRNNCPIDKNNPCNKAFRLKALKTGKIISIEFDIPSFEIKNLIYLMFILGGFGKRSRRGFGSLHIIEPEIKINLEEILKFLNKIENIYEIDNSSFLSSIKSIKNKKTSNGNYPWVKEIILGDKKGFANANQILEAIGLAAHKHSDPSLGVANPRMSSPIYVSVVKINGKFYPIITILNFSQPANYPSVDLVKQNDFIKELL